MARTVIDVDDALLAEAAKIFGTKTKVATVNAALEDVVKRRDREEFLNWIAEGGLPDLTGPVEESAPAAVEPEVATEHMQDRAA
ncbi:type II toxin-antitoxin system VapB family antitoxin [Streptomyces sp. NBC_01351]|uniref:type II toxin-antitoxin system VapB family antitoxin n=1 Tax=Streptomyces sp. NBC_01351 TaxID=2903833 RepID=UPI002E342884|nr:type II toxin-antitoxin system VapB family antitoxin [Streptomyces sp. NBC_01351]